MSTNNLKLFLVTRNDDVGYDEYDSWLVATPNSTDVLLKLNLCGNYAYSEITIKQVGEALPETEPGVIIASFNAG